MIHVRSQRDLIQESYYPDEFKVMVCCLLLNRTRGEQVRSVVDTLFARWPTAEAMLQGDVEEQREMLRPLGLYNRRVSLLRKFSAAYLEKNWKHVSELPGIGAYASSCWEIFFQEELGDDPPNDGPLTDYWIFAKVCSDWPRTM